MPAASMRAVSGGKHLPNLRMIKVKKILNKQNPHYGCRRGVSKHCIILFFENMVPNLILDVFSPAKNKTVLI
jgi:hypothetical protein